MEIQEQEIVSLNEVCIACLIKTDNMKQLLYADKEILQLITKLSSVSNLEIELNDTLPCFLCSTCEEKLHISYDFQQLCQKSHQFILACLSATSSVALKVNNTFKPIQLDDSSGNTEIHSEHLENNSDSSTTFNNNDVSYEESEADVPVDETDNFFILKETPNIASIGSFGKVNSLKESCIKNYNIKIEDTNSNELLNNEVNFVKPSEVDERIQCNQAMRLEYSSEDVDKIIIELDEDSSDIKLQPGQMENESNNSITFINNDSPENLEEKCIKMGNINTDELLNDEENFVKPLEVDRRTKSNQTMRLPQYTSEEVDKIIRRTRMRFFKHVDCLYCGFTAKDTRALSLHMTRLHREQKKRWCLWCNNSFENMNEHIKNDHKDDFKCPLCGKYRTSTGHFMEHLASHSTERKYVCKICEKSFISARHLKMHYKVHTDKPFICQICCKGFMLLKSLKTHLKSHHKHWCVTCEEYLESASEYLEHKCFSKELKEDEAEDKIKEMPQNYCKICNRKVRSLQRHLEEHHSNKKKDVKDLKALCTYCGKQFSSVAKLTVHVRIHTGESPYECSFCDKRMTTRVHLVVHERTHTGEKPYACKICGRRFAQSSVLNTHMRLHTGRPEQCTICFKKFCRPSELRQHMRNHTGEKPFECASCGQAFKQKSHLVEHNKTHSNERPYKCEYCDKSFKQSGTLKSHINIHLGKKPYKCSQCSYACRQSYCLSQHMQQHENDQPKPDRPHKCAICGRSFTTIAMFTSHYNSQHRTLDSS